MSSPYGLLYYSMQRLRHGVTQSMVAAAREVLEMPPAALRERAITLLRTIHGRQFDSTSLQSAPLIERSTLIPAASAIIQSGRSRRRIEVRRTSGSTGTPFTFPRDRWMTAWMDAAMWAVYEWHGVAPGLAHARFWGMPLQRLKRVRTATSDRLLNRTRINAFELSPAKVDHQFRAVIRRRARYAYGYPTLMKAFADNCRAAGLDGRELGFQVVISTGELLTPQVRHELAGFFGCAVVNEYGCTESGILGFECRSGRLHVVPVAVWPEVVDHVGAPVPDGVAGEVVISDLFGSTLPLLRYRLHDRATVRSEPCSCGRSLACLEVATGRSDSFITTPRGPVYDAILAYSVPAAVLRFKAFQVAPDRIDAQVVPRPGADPRATADDCRERWEGVLGPGIAISVRPVSEIALEPSGKLRYFVPLEHRREST